ncbi:protein FATTY ACID EXPORT 3, chloroplastic [Heracleum sosnowskyi]|uniref:Protein FATTY ACID EXPORT 3, chloroplastic n=1 Tax=Heracleum sosnowskyi TaxID=360622 RepID=A0AAD8GNB9_9APIA|nr:protein FATTY ACID EXPORT 3, chloroplastic [Heracleum sosnowskyi]
MNPSEAEDSKEKSDVNVEANESEEAWKQTLALFKEKALVMQSVSQEAYEQYSKKAAVVFKEASEQLKVQAEKAKQDLSVIAKEVSEEEDLDEISEVRDFYLGIPYGLLLSVGGFLSFMITGSIPAIRFGIILGGALLALSISSFQSWKRGESSSTALKGQAAIATILFLRDIRIVFVRSSVANFLTAFISGAMLAFYIYRTILDGKHTGGSNSEPEIQQSDRFIRKDRALGEVKLQIQGPTSPCLFQGVGIFDSVFILFVPEDRRPDLIIELQK